MSQPKIKLQEWAKRNWSPPPSDTRLWSWARGGRIRPPPQKVGRDYYVTPDAKYVDRNGRPT